MVIFLALAWGSRGFWFQLSSDTSTHESEAMFEVGRSLNLLSRFGFFALTMRILPPIRSSAIISEDTRRVFELGSTSIETHRERNQGFHIYLCPSVSDILDATFSDFWISGLSQAWKAFVPDRRENHLTHRFGVEPNFLNLDHRFVLVKVSHVQLSMELTGNRVPEKEILKDQTRIMKQGNAYSCHLFADTHGTHYIRDLKIGNFFYQVLVYDPKKYEALERSLEGRRHVEVDSTADLPRKTSSYLRSAKAYGEIMVGNEGVQVSDRMASQFSVQAGPDLFVYPDDPFLLALPNASVATEILKQDKESPVITGILLQSLFFYFDQNLSSVSWCGEILDNAMKLFQSNMT